MLSKDSSSPLLSLGPPVVPLLLRETESSWACFKLTPSGNGHFLFQCPICLPCAHWWGSVLVGSLLMLQWGPGLLTSTWFILPGYPAAHWKAVINETVCFSSCFVLFYHVLVGEDLRSSLYQLRGINLRTGFLIVGAFSGCPEHSDFPVLL